MNKFDWNKIGFITIVLAAIVSCLTFWGTYGWITRMAYAQDHANAPTSTQMATIQKSLDTIITAQKMNQDQWECDEMDEEIPELLKDRAQATLLSDQIDIERDIEKQRERWVELKCSRFTE